MKCLEKKELWTIFALLCFTVLGLWLFWGKQGHILIDVGREFLISEQVSQGKVLYKDIFNIYGPLAYQINALLFKLFGNCIMTLYIAGVLTALGIVTATYILARQFFTTGISGCITAAVIGAGVYQGAIFNYVMPYSYAVLYGLLAVTISLIFLIRYIKNKDGDIRNFYISLLFGGIAFTFKYDFAPYALIFPYIAFFIKKLNTKELFYSALFAILVPVLSLSNLIVQGLSFADITNTIKLLGKIANAPALTFFYKLSGLYPTTANLITTLKNFLIIGLGGLILGLLLWFSTKKYQKLILTLIFGVCFLIILKYGIASKLTFLPLLLIVLLLIKIKPIFSKKENFVFILSTLLISLKTIFCFRYFSYGIYYLPFILISLTLLAQEIFIKKEQFFRLITCFVLILFATSTTVNTYYKQLIPSLKHKIETEKGAIASVSANSSTHLLLKKLETIPKDKTIVVLPEGHFINYLTDHNSDPFYNNFIPMYVEAFGEQNIINHYTKNMPDYFILNTRDCREYGHQYICKDYAQELCSWIQQNYHVVYNILGEPEYLVLRKN